MKTTIIIIAILFFAVIAGLSIIWETAPITCSLSALLVGVCCFRIIQIADEDRK